MRNVTSTTTSDPKSSRSSPDHSASTDRDAHFPSLFPRTSYPRTERVPASDMVLSLFLQALLGLLAFDVFGFSQDFARLHRCVSNWKLSADEATDKAVTDVCIAVNYACAWYPKRVLCLQRSAVTTCLLRHHGVPAAMVLGVQILPFKAHAWTEVSGTAVNERRDVQKSYTVWERC